MNSSRFAFFVVVVMVLPQPTFAASLVQKSVALIVSQEHHGTSNKAVRALRGQFSDLPVAVDVRWVSSIPPAFPAQIAAARQITRQGRFMAAIWCDFSTAKNLYFYLSEPKGERVLVRAAEGKSADARFETMAIIARSSVKALLAGGAIGVAEPAKVRSTTKTTASETERFALQLAYQLEGFSEAELLAHGLRLRAVVRVQRYLSAFAGVQLVSAAAGVGPQASVRLQRYPFALGLQANVSWGRLHLGGGVAAQVEYLDAEAQVIPYNWVVQAPAKSWLFSLVPGVFLAFEATDTVVPFVSLESAVVLNNREFLAQGPDKTTVLLAPWRVRPRILAGLSLRLF